MLLAVEGGGLFSSSASGYRKGLTFLLLGQKTKDKPMRVTPWNQHQLVVQETYPNIQLDSHKNHLVRGCASFICFGRATAGLKSTSLAEVGPTQQPEVLTEVSIARDEKDPTSPPDVVVEENGIENITIRSSLKKPKNTIEASCGSNEEHAILSEEGNKVGSEISCEKGNEVSSQMKRMKVQWTDMAGGDLFEIREFEPSDDGGSDDEFDNGNDKTCSCTIM